MNQGLTRGVRERAVSVVACTSLIVLASVTAFAQAPTTAVLTRWDIFAGSGGVNTSSTSATRHVRLVATASDGSVWLVSELPAVRLGRLDPVANSYSEWAPLAGGETGGVPDALALGVSNGDVWLATGGTPALAARLSGSNTFRKYTLPYAGAVVKGIAPTPDGTAVYVAIRAGGNTSILRIERGSEPLGGATSVNAARWRFASSSDDPAHLTMDGAGFLWFTNKFRNTVARFDPSLSTNNLVQWTLPAGTSAAGLRLIDGASGAATVCVVAEGAVTGQSGQPSCLDVATSTFRVLAGPTGLDFSPQVSVTGAGELFVSEQNGNAVTFIASAGVAAGTLQPVTPLTGVSNTRLASAAAVSVGVADASVTPVTRTVAPATSSITGTESAGHVRFGLPPLPALPDEPGQLRQSRPVGLTAAFGSTGAGTGSVYLAEYFNGPSPIVPQMAGAVSLLTLGGATPDEFLAQPSSLTFSADIGAAGPTALVSVEERNGRTLSWTATKTQPWLTLSPASGTTPASMTVTIDHSALSAGGSPFTDTITIDDGAGGAAPVTIPVSLTVVERPTMVITPGLLYFTAVNTDTTPPGAKTFAISSQGGGTLEWTATANAPGVEVLLEKPGEPLATTVSGSGPATVTVHVRSVPGTAGLREGTIAISSSNATNGSASVDIDYEVTSVTQALLVDRASLGFDIVAGQTATVSDVVNVTNASGASVTWGTVFPYTEAAPPPSWIQVSPAVAESAAGATIPMTVTVDASALSPGTHSAVITIDDHTGNSPPAVVGVLVVVRAAAIAFSDDAVSIPVTEGGESATQSVTLSNPGDAPLVFTPVVTMNTGAGWLTVTPTGELTLEPGGSLPFTVTTNPVGLPPGTYTGQITVANPYSVNGSDTVFITMVVAAPADTTPPVISGAADVTAEATGASGASVSYAQPTALDDNDGMRTVSCTPASGSTFPVGDTTVTCTASDTRGNTASTTFVVTVTPQAGDTTPPSISAPPSQTIEATGPSGAPATFAATATDDNGTPTITYTNQPGSTFPLGTTVVTATATDGAGNTASATFSITVRDTTGPAISGATPVTAAATGPSGAVVTFAPTASDLVSGTVAVTCTPASGATFAVGTTTVNCSATDGAGNTSTASFGVTVTAEADTTPPTLTVPGNMTVAADGPSGTVVTFAASASDTVSGALTPACTPPAGSTFPVGTTTVTCTATDAAGNTGTATFTVTVTAPADTTPPSVTVPGSMTVEVAGPSGTPVTFTTSAFDAVSGALTPACTPSSGSTFPLGTTTVTCTATDAAGNAGTASFTITVRDTTPPSVTPPPNQVVEAAGPVSVSYPPATATDLAGAVTLTYSHASGSTFPLGATTVTVTATDGAGNPATATFTVTVNPPADTMPPVISVPASQVLEATSPAGAVATFSATATDNSGAAPTITYSHASGGTFQLGVTTVTVTARDAAGNTATVTFTITVRDTIAPALNSVPASFAVQTTTSAAVVSYTMPTASDIADATPTVVCTPASGSSLPANATHTITCTATDDSGNAASASFQVTVQQITPYSVSPANGLYFKTGRLAYCNGLPVGPNWKDQGFVVTNNTASGLGYTITTATSWVRVQPVSGTIAGSSSTTLVVSVDLTALGRGIYQGSFTITAGGVSTVVPVTLEIGNALPTLCLTPTSMTWGKVKGGVTLASRTYDVLNVGDDPMANWMSTKSITNGTLTVSATSGTSPKTVTVTVKTGKAKGNHSARINMSVPGAVNGTQAIDMTWTVQ